MEAFWSNRFFLPVLASAGVGVIILDQLVLAWLGAAGRARLWSLIVTCMICAGSLVCIRLMKAGMEREVHAARASVQAVELKREEMEHTEKLRMAGTLAAGIAHEIRNPLTSLRGFLQLSAKNGYPYTDIMLSELDRINVIVGEMLELASPKESVYHPQLLQPLLQNVITLLQPQATLNGVQLMGRYGKETASLVVYCSETKLKQVFINLIKNAIEVMPVGGNIVISLYSAKDTVLIDITDEGPGMPPEMMEKIGEPFFTTKSNGTGLGLMVTRRIVVDHRGTLSFRSSWKGGTVVTVKLPIYYGNGGL